jgi:hypothetical protein
MCTLHYSLILPAYSTQLVRLTAPLGQPQTNEQTNRLTSCNFIVDVSVRFFGTEWSLQFTQSGLYTDETSTFTLAAKHVGTKISTFARPYGAPRCRGRDSNCSTQKFKLLGARISLVGWGNFIQAGRSQVRLPISSSEFSVDLILPAALGLGVDLASNRNEYQESSWA